MSANTNLGNTPVNQGYVQLIHTGETGGIDGTLRALYDGDGTASDLLIASNAVKVSTQLYIGSKTITEYIQDTVGDMFDTNGSHTNLTASYDDEGDGAIDLNASGAVSGITAGTGITTSGSGNITINVDTSSIATRSYVDTEVSGLVDSAPSTLDTLNELAAALGDDANFSTTTATNIGTKLAKASNLSDLTNAGTARTNLGVDPAGTDNSTNVSLSGSLDYITISGQTITRNAVNLTTDITGTLPVANGGTGLTSISTLLNSNITPSSLGLVIGTNVQAQDTLLQDIADFSTSSPSNDGKVVAYQDSDGTLVLSNKLSPNGSTANGLLTYNTATLADVESELTYSAGTLQIHRTSGNSILKIRSDDSNPRIYFAEGSTVKANLGYSISNNRFELYNGNTPFSIEDGAGSNTLVVDSNSRVGIGTASPTYELDVVGNAGINGNLYHNGDTDTYLQFDTDRIRLIAGSSTKFDSNNTYVETSRSITPVSNRGISGGGDLSADRTIELSASQLGSVALTTSDQLILFDQSDSDIPKRFNAQDIFDTISGAVTSYTNTGNDRVLTSSGGTTINGEANLTFNGSTLSLTGALTASSTITTNYGVSFTNGNTNFLQYNNSGEDVLYLRDITNSAMLLTYGTTRTTIHKNTRHMDQVEFEDTNAVINRVSNDLEIRTYGGYSINLMAAGNVGIGDDNPPNKLSVKGSSTDLLYLEGDGITSNSIIQSATGGSTRIRSAGGKIEFYTDGSANSSSASGADFAMVINASKNVGIGSTSVNGKLTVRDDTAGSPCRLTISNGGTAQSGTSSRLSFYEGQTEKSYIERRRDGTGQTAFITPADDNPFVWENASGEFMRFNNSVVCIGHTSPWTSTVLDLGATGNNMRVGGTMYFYDSNRYIRRNGNHLEYYSASGEHNFTGNVETSGSFKMDNTDVMDTNKRLVNLTSAQGTDRSGGTHIVDFATPNTPGSTGWYTICKASSVNARGGGVINISVTGGSMTPTALTIDFMFDWSGVMTCTTKGHSGQLTKIRAIETASTTELQVYVNTTVAQTVYVSLEQDRYNPNFSLLDPWATATPATTQNEFNLNGFTFGFPTTGMSATMPMGSMGIGTSTPAHTLDVSGNTRNFWYGSAISRTESTAGGYGAYKRLITTTNAYDLVSLNGDFLIDEQGVATRLIIKDTTGHVGLNESSPTTELHLGTCPDARAITFDQSGRFNGIGNYYSSNATDSYVDFYCSDGGTNGDTNSRMKIYADGRLKLTNSNNVDMLLAKATQMGYSNSYRALVIGETSGNFTTCIGYDPSGNSSGSFTGDGREIIFRNGAEFTTPNSSNNGFHNDIIVLKDGNVGINNASPDAKLEVSESGTGHGLGGIITETTTHNGNAGIRFRTNGTDRWAITCIGTNGSDLRIRDADGSADRIQIDSSGDLHCDQDVIAFSTTPSDKRLKKNIKNIEYGLEAVMQLDPKQYDWKKDNKHDIGFIAQEVEQVIPEIVKDKKHFDKEIKTLDYEKLTAVLIKAVQEQQQQINKLEEKLNG